MYQALYRAYRPEVFSEVLGQEHIVRILTNQIKSQTTSHAYLFCGTRGTGKTTTARLLAKGLNCLDEGERPCGKCANCLAIKEGSFMDVIEIDAASNNGVENIRELRESVNYPPAVGRNKVYIIDEVHMLSTGAFNALLKTLEEPPEYVTFILATTEIHKLPATILSRCMRLDFKRVPEKTLITGFADICEKIGIDATEDALRIIAANADGSVRDGLSILDQCISAGDKKIDSGEVLEFLGASSQEDFLELTDMVRKKRTSEAIAFLSEILSDGKDVRQFIRDWINHFRNLLMVKFMRDPTGVINLSDENIDRLRRQAAAMDLEDVNRGILELSRTASEARWSTQPRILLEMCIVKLCMGAGEIRDLTADPVRSESPAQQSKEAAVNKSSVQNENDAHNAKPVKTDSPVELTAVGSEADRDNKPEVTAESTPAAESNSIPAGKPAPAASPDSATAQDQDCEKIWNEVFEEGENEIGSFMVIRSSGKLRSIDEDSFTVIAAHNIAKGHIENNRKLIEDLMAKHTGRHRRMVIADDKTEKTKKTPEQIAEEISSVIGVEVEVR